MRKKNIFLLLGLVSLLSAMDKDGESEIDTKDTPDIHAQCNRTIENLKLLNANSETNQTKLTFTQTHVPELIASASVAGLVFGLAIIPTYRFGKMMYEITVLKQFWT